MVLDYIAEHSKLILSNGITQHELLFKNEERVKELVQCICKYKASPTGIHIAPHAYRVSNINRAFLDTEVYGLKLGGVICSPKKDELVIMYCEDKGINVKILNRDSTIKDLEILLPCTIEELCHDAVNNIKVEQDAMALFMRAAML